MDLEKIRAAITAHRASCPLTMCIQNFVAMDFSANVLLAAGASPAMVDAEEECAGFCAISSALSINVGTALSSHWLASMYLAVGSNKLQKRALFVTLAAAAQEKGKPWCLDPVACGASAHRTDACVKLMHFRPTVVRGNASEIMALAAACKVEVPEGTQSGGGKGVDSTDTSESAFPSALALCKEFGPLVVAVSGETDIITDGNVKVSVRNGQEMLTKITAAGCSLSAMCASYCSVAEPLDGVIAAFLHFTVASDEAVAMPEVKGPGTLRVHLLDKLYSLTVEDIIQNAKVTREKI